MDIGLDPIADNSFVAFDTSSPHSLRYGEEVSPPLNFIDDDDDDCDDEDGGIGGHRMRQQEKQHDYNFSGSVYNPMTDAEADADAELSTEIETGTETEEGDAEVADEDEDDYSMPSSLRFSPSRHSSVSSFPTSVIHHVVPSQRRQREDPRRHDGPHTPTRSPSKSPFHYPPVEAHVRTSPSFHLRAHSNGFRHPSSVRALQMRDEYEFTDADDLTPHHRRNSRLSYISYRSSGSAHSSPTKSMRTRSAQSSPYKTGKAKVKKEFPLVLLHCTLLPPPLFTRANILTSEKEGKDSVLEAIIPEPYVKRWKALQEKVMRNSEVKTRGVLIPHPRDDYELLEEKLLESLELEKPRIHNGHFVVPAMTDNRPGSANDSGFESADSSSSRDEQSEMSTNEVNQNHEQKCPDCGHEFAADEAQRTWEVKVFAANGLMRAGAWGAAWPEMEKVDVEVDIWMPLEVRREVDNRLEALILKDQEEMQQQQQQQQKKKRRRRGLDDERAREIYGEQEKEVEVEPEPQLKSQAEIDGFPLEEANSSVVDSSVGQRQQYQQQQTISNTTQPVATAEPDLLSALMKYLWLLARDGRNIAIVLLSIVLLFKAFNTAPPVTQMSHSSTVGRVGAGDLLHSADTTISTTSLASVAAMSHSVKVATPSATPVADSDALLDHQSVKDKTLNIAEHLVANVSDLDVAMDADTDSHDSSDDSRVTERINDQNTISEHVKITKESDELSPTSDTSSHATSTAAERQDGQTSDYPFPIQTGPAAAEDLPDSEPESETVFTVGDSDYSFQRMELNKDADYTPTVDDTSSEQSTNEHAIFDVHQQYQQQEKQDKNKDEDEDEE